MPARSTRILFINQTNQILNNLGTHLDHGGWTNNQPPPATIAPNGTGYWEAESDGVATGTEGHITFAIGPAPKPGTPAAKSAYVHWDNPFSGQDKYNVMVSPGFQCFRQGGGGDNANLHIVLRPAVPHHTGFKPTTSGYRFVNHWPNTPYSLPPLRGSVLDFKYGNAVNGLCGGMVDSARDYFQAKMPIPATTTAPSGERDPLFVYIVKRLFDTFDIDDVSLYLKYMSPAYPDTDENVLNSVGVADGRASVVINTEYPIIRADIDGGTPSCLGLVTIKSLLPTDLGHCHQVMCWGYLENGMEVTLFIYDPNQPSRDDIFIKFNTQDWSKPINIVHNVDCNKDGVKLPIHCLFRTHYTFNQPPRL